MTTAATGTAAATGTGTDPAVVAGAAAAASAPAAASTNWIEGLAPDLKEYATTKDFKDPGSVLDSYRNLEKTIGVPKERLLKLPEKADAPEWNEIYGRLGRPEKAEGYKIPVPEGDKGEFAKTVAPWFHEAGLSQKQAEKVASKWNEYIASEQKKVTDASTLDAGNAERELKTKWGAAYDQNLQAANQAAEKFGIDQTQADALKTAMGRPKAVEFLYNLAAKLGEADFVVGDGGRPGAGKKFTPDQANQRIQSLKGDEEFGKKLAMGNSEAVDEWTKLHMMANPEPV